MIDLEKMARETMEFIDHHGCPGSKDGRCVECEEKILALARRALEGEEGR